MLQKVNKQVDKKFRILKLEKSRKTREKLFSFQLVFLLFCSLIPYQIKKFTSNYTIYTRETRQLT